MDINEESQKQLDEDWEVFRRLNERVLKEFTPEDAWHNGVVDMAAADAANDIMTFIGEAMASGVMTPTSAMQKYTFGNSKLFFYIGYLMGHEGHNLQECKCEPVPGVNLLDLRREQTAEAQRNNEDNGPTPGLYL